MSKTAAQSARPQYEGDTQNSAPIDSSRQKSQFVQLALQMGWQLAVVVLVPVIGGVQLDKAFNTAPVLLLLGFGVAVVGSILVMWRTMQSANRLPVPKLTAAQRQAVKKSYDEDDRDD
jgi:F0F1-type ATP synthase assembly protein I